MSAPQPVWRASLTPEDSSERQDTPPEDRLLRRAMDAATLDLIRSAASAPVQMAEMAGQLAGLRQETRDGFTRLDAHATATEGQLRELVTLQREANAQRAQELAAREEAARWWRSLITPQGVIYLVAVLVTVLGALLGVGHLIPQPRVGP